MIESLRKSKSRSLALFAACTFSIGFQVGLMVQWFSNPNAPAPVSAHAVGYLWVRDSLEKNAALAAWGVAQICILLCLISFLVLAVSFIRESRGTDNGMLRFSARALYLLSVIGLIAAISNAFFFVMCHI